MIYNTFGIPRLRTSADSDQRVSLCASRFSLSYILDGISVQKWKKGYEPSTVKSDEKIMFQVKCADCGCLPEECKNSPSAKECPNCSWDECCCWATIVNK